jgi:hypothetical protein
MQARIRYAGDGAETFDDSLLLRLYRVERGQHAPEQDRSGSPEKQWLRPRILAAGGTACAALAGSLKDFFNEVFGFVHPDMVVTAVATVN